MNENEAAWRKAIADQVRANCTPSSDAYAKGGDVLIYAVCDWIENPPDWSHFNSPDAPKKVQVGSVVDCIIGSEFSVNGVGTPIRVVARNGGKVVGKDEFGKWNVTWPNGETYSYQESLLEVRVAVSTSTESDDR